MTLRWSWQKLLLCSLIDVNGRLDKRVLESGESIRYAALGHPPIHNVRENQGKSFGVECSHVHHAEVPREPVSDGISSTAGWSHRCDELYVQQRSEGELLAIVPATVVHPLSQDLDWWLSTIHLNLWHVHIVDKDHHLLSNRRTKNSLASLVELTINDVLGHVGTRLRREVTEHGAVLCGIHAVLEMLLDVHTLSCSRWTNNHAVVAVIQEDVDQVSVPDRVHSLNDDVCELGLWIKGLLLHSIQPRQPLSFLLLEREVKHTLAVWEELDELYRWSLHERLEVVWGVVQQDLPQILVKDLPSLLVHRRPNAPDKGEQEEALKPAEDKILVHALDQFRVLEFVEKRLEQASQGHDKVDLLQGDGHLAHLCHDPEGWWNEPVKEVHDVLLVALSQAWWQIVHPRFHGGPPSQEAWLHVNHATPTHGGWTGDGKIRDLEDHVHQASHGDDFSRVQAKLLVVVQDSVHVLNPNCINGTIEHEPLPIWGCVPRSVSEEHGKNTIRPLLGHGVILAVQLAHGDTLRVQNVVFCLLLPEQALLMQICQGSRQNFVGRGLHTKALSHNHETVPDDDHLIELGHLRKEGVKGLQVVLLAALRQSFPELHVVSLWHRDPREEIAKNSLKERDILVKEFWEVHIDDGLQHQCILRLILQVGTPLEITRSSQDSHNRTHTVIVVILTTKLFGAKLVCLHQLSGHWTRFKVSKGVQNDFGNQGIVRNHHSHISEQGLQVIWQLRTSSVTWVHGDEDVASQHELQLGALEHELLQSSGNCALNCEDLLSNDREHFKFNTVELIETRPRSRASQTLEELAHRLVVKAIGAIEDHTLDGQSLREILRGLCFTGSRRTGWGPSEAHVDGTHQRTVAPISKRCNDQSSRVTVVLVPVVSLGIDHSDHDGLSLEPLVVLLPVVPELTLPLKVFLLRDTIISHLLHDIPRVHVNDHQSTAGLSLKTRQVSPHEVNNLVQLLSALG